MQIFPKRTIELIEGSDGKISSIKVCTYLVVITLCIVLLRADSEDKASIAMIAAGLAVGREINQRVSEVKMVKAKRPPANPATHNVTVENAERVEA